MDTCAFLRAYANTRSAAGHDQQQAGGEEPGMTFDQLADTTERVVQQERSRVVTSDDRWEGRAIAHMIRTRSDPLLPDDHTLGAQRTQVGPFYAYTPMPERQIRSMRNLLPFYTEAMLRSMLPFISQSGPVPLRDLEWVCTNEAREKTLIINGVDVFGDYTAKRRGNRKRNFEPYCKRVRWAFDVDGKVWYTSLGQLNFMKWALETGIIEYAIRNKESIVKHREETKRRVKEEMNNGLRPHRMALTKPPKRAIYALSGTFANVGIVTDDTLREQQLDHLVSSRTQCPYSSFDDAVRAAGMDPNVLYADKHPKQRSVRKRVRVIPPQSPDAAPAET
jgi:hypothetical protein